MSFCAFCLWLSLSSRRGRAIDGRISEWCLDFWQLMYYLTAFDKEVLGTVNCTPLAAHWVKSSLRQMQGSRVPQYS